jgi:hypothetical protein
MTGFVRPERVNDRNRNLETAIAREMWPTPTASLGTKGGRVTERKGKEGGTLIEAVSARAMWRTPNRVDAKGGTRNGAGQVQLCHQVGGALNPTWVEWLMGFPSEWTALDASEMPSSRRSRKSSGAQS